MGKIYCSVADCWEPNGGTLSKHRFPNPKKDKELFHKWVAICANKKLHDKDMTSEKIYQNCRVCSKHFSNSDFDRNNILKREAFPSIYVPMRMLDGKSEIKQVANVTENLVDDNDSPNALQLCDGGSDNEEVPNETDPVVDDIDSWSSLEISALIETYGQHRNLFTRDGHDLLAWDHISADLSSKNIKKTPESCEKKWKALFQIYLLNKRKPNRIHFEFHNEIDNIIGDEHVEEENRKRKRDCGCFEKKMSEKNRRHRERMEMVKKKLDIEKQKLIAFEKYIAYLKAGKK